MLSWTSIVVLSVALVAGGAAYIQIRWLKSPQAYAAMIGLGCAYFVAGSLAGAWVMHLAQPGAIGGPSTISERERAEGFKAFCAAYDSDPDSKHHTLEDLIPAATAILERDPNISSARIKAVVDGTVVDLHSGALTFNCK